MESTPDRLRRAARTLTGWWLTDLVMATYLSWRNHRTIRLGAGLAYYGLTSIVPVVAVGVAVASLVLDAQQVSEALTDILIDLFGANGRQVADAVGSSVDASATATGLGLLGFGSLLFTASLLFVALQDALDTIFEVPYRAGARNTIRRRALSFLVVLLTGAFIVASFVVAAFAGVIRRLAPGEVLVVELVADLFAVVGSWALIAAVLVLLFRYLTTTDLGWRVAAVAGVSTAAALSVGNRLVGEYLSRYGVSSLAGATGALLVVLLWIYAIAQIVLAGAELAAQLQRRWGDERARPADGVQE